MYPEGRLDTFWMGTCSTMNLVLDPSTQLLGYQVYDKSLVKTEFTVV